MLYLIKMSFQSIFANIKQKSCYASKFYLCSGNNYGFLFIVNYFRFGTFLNQSLQSTLIHKTKM